MRMTGLRLIERATCFFKITSLPSLVTLVTARTPCRVR